ncbi:hypothetical protein BDF21DRAFT_397808 [Thamnidium elegans]|nr:hypothetical protein BDF21DRAFT_397808 [Thamnidium elegans]
MHTKRFHELQFQYYDKMVVRIENPTMIDCINNNNKKTAFYLTMGFHLSVIKEKFIPFMDQSISMIDGVVLKNDHSFKIIRHLGKANGTSIFASLSTAMNKYEEIRVQVLAYTKSLRGLSGSFEFMMESYCRYGFYLPQVFYIDNIVIDKNILETYTSSNFSIVINAIF